MSILKNKFLFIMILSMSLFVIACSNDYVDDFDDELDSSVNLSDEKLNYNEKKDVMAEEENYELDNQSADTELIDQKFEFAKDDSALSESQIKELEIIYDKLVNFDFTDENAFEYDDLWIEFDKKLASMGIDVPFISYFEIADKYIDLLSISDYNKIIEIDEKIMFLGDDISDEEYEELGNDIIDILNKYDLPGKEVKNQVDMRNVQLALFDVKSGMITLSSNSVKSELSEEDRLLYEKFWKHIKTIIPRNYLEKFIMFEVNTDGVANVMAHVIEEDDDMSVWRLAVDIKDSVDTDGNFTSEFNNTVIHEFSHVMTLNKDQMQIGEVTDDDTFEVQEGKLKKDAYLNQFYNKFWKEIYDEHQKALDKDYENGMFDGGDAIYEFYEKYEDRFHTDYAATNPGEDIAESYRFFVVEDKPTGNSIKDQKILFFYEMSEFVEIRKKIRENLEL